MYHYSECGLSNIYLVNGFIVEVEGEQEFISISEMNSLHHAIAMNIIERATPLTHEEFRFLRIELNQSQKALATHFDVTEQTVARYEKNQTKIPRTADICLRYLYGESRNKKSSLSDFLEKLASTEAEAVASDIHLKAEGNKWVVMSS
jgi:DNA-binding transcriptional regulator YiaG